MSVKLINEKKIEAERKIQERKKATIFSGNYKV